MTLYMLPTVTVSVLTGFDCLDFQDLAGARGWRRGIGPQQACPLTFKFAPAGLLRACA